MTPPDFPQYTAAAQRGNKGVRIVENIVHDRLGWIFREQEGQKDFGIDAHIELMDDNKALGRLLALQIKCGESFFNQRNDDGYVFYGEKKHLNYFLNYPFPVLIVLCNPSTDECWWCEVDFLEIENTEMGWRITVPFHQKFDSKAKEQLIELAGPAKDYLPQLEHYWSVNNLLQKSEDTLLFVIPREDVESGDFGDTVTALNRIRVTKSLTRSYQDRIDISIFGYDDDSRELFEIPEVREWIRGLDEIFPYWFFFLSKEFPGLNFIAFALCEYHQRPRGGFELDKQSFAAFLEAHFVAMNEICMSLGFSEEKIKELSENIITYYIGEKPPPEIYTSRS